MNIIVRALFVILFASIVIYGCKQMSTEKNFNRLKDRFPALALPFVLNDSIAFDEWTDDDSLLSIDTILVKQFDLLTAFRDTSNLITDLSRYHCSSIGRYHLGSNIVILYKTYTSEAGGGNPKVIAGIFNEQGEKLDERVVLWNNERDPFYSSRIRLSILDEQRLTIDATEFYSQLNGGTIELVNMKKHLWEYDISLAGKIVLGHEVSKDSSIVEKIDF